MTKKLFLMVGLSVLPLSLFSFHPGLVLREAAGAAGDVANVAAARLAKIANVSSFYKQKADAKLISNDATAVENIKKDLHGLNVEMSNEEVDGVISKIFGLNPAPVTPAAPAKPGILKRGLNNSVNGVYATGRFVKNTGVSSYNVVRHPINSFNDADKGLANKTTHALFGKNATPSKARASQYPATWVVAGLAALGFEEYKNGFFAKKLFAKPVAPVKQLTKFEQAKKAFEKAKISTKNAVCSKTAKISAAVVAAALGGYALLQSFSAPSFDDLVQEYVYGTTEQDPKLIVEKFFQALEKYGYTSEEDKQKAMEVLEEAGLIKE